VKRAATAVVVTVLCVLLYEASVRGLYRLGAEVPALRGIQGAVGFFVQENAILESGWEKDFLGRWRNGATFSSRIGGLFAPHPTRGWSTVADRRETIAGIPYATNNMGHRSPDDWSFAPERFRILALGDSFTFNHDHGDREDWPYRLGLLDGRYQVVNLGVSGYGIDQMLVTLEETIDLYRPHMVVMAFIGDDMARALLSFRDYAKPRFRVDDGILRQVGEPIPPPGDLARGLEGRGFVTDRPVFQLKTVFTGWVLARLARDAAEREPLASAILDRTLVLTRERGAGFLPAYLGANEELERPATTTAWGERLFERWRQANGGNGVNARQAFLTLMDSTLTGAGHYDAAQNAAVARMVRDAVAGSPEWRRWRSETH
jgi:hypothetical protein